MRFGLRIFPLPGRAQRARHGGVVWVARELKAPAIARDVACLAGFAGLA